MLQKTGAKCSENPWKVKNESNCNCGGHDASSQDVLTR